ncbi:MAG TPA: sterol desaturase family protein [Thermoanaerobaculia bacterium]|nr:sterol desaturase family protein [Thermoanaerobaculia bacterium]
MHHSPARIEAITSFYKHPLEIAANSLISSLLIYALLGGSTSAGAWFNVFAAIGEMFYHANIATPVWWGYFMQRPEHHSIHHQLDVHSFNFGDITWWDRLFGTFRDTRQFAPACGFAPGREERLARMLLFKANT